MEYNAFTGGVRPGGLTTTPEIITMICWLLREARQPVSYDQLREALLREELVNYFEFAGTLDAITASGHLVKTTLNGVDYYQITTLGMDTAAAFGDKLPLSVRMRASQILDDIRTILRRRRDNLVEISENGGGFTVSLAIRDVGGELLSVSMFMPTREDCERIRLRFMNEPTLIYKGVFALLTGDIKTVGELLPEGRNLFGDDEEVKTDKD